MTSHEHKQNLRQYGERAIENKSVSWEEMEAIRRLLCLSRQELADLIGVTYTRVYQMENGNGCTGGAAVAIGLLCMKPHSVRYFFPDKTAEIKEAFDLPFEPYRQKEDV